MNTNSIDTAAAESLCSFAVANNELQFAHLVTAALNGEQWAVERVQPALSAHAAGLRDERDPLTIIRATDTTRPDGATPRGSGGPPAVVSTIPSAHIDLARQYGCRAYQTIVTFMFAGIVHRARRFFRADMPTTGKVELYTCEPFAGQWTTCTEFGWYDSAMCEDFLCYADGNSRRDQIARALIEAAIGGDLTGAEQSERYAAIELI